MNYSFRGSIVRVNIGCEVCSGKRCMVKDSCLIICNGMGC